MSQCFQPLWLTVPDADYYLGVIFDQRVDGQPVLLSVVWGQVVRVMRVIANRGTLRSVCHGWRRVRGYSSECRGGRQVKEGRVLNLERKDKKVK